MPTDVAAPSDADLCAQALEGNRQSLDVLYDRLKPRLLATAYALCGDASSAEDLVHEVFAALWERRGKLAPPASPAAYLATAVRNAWRNRRAKQERSWRVPGRASRPAVPDDEGRAALVREAVAALPDHLREVLTLHRHAGLTYAEIAEGLGITIKAVEGRMTRAFVELRRRLRPLLEGA